MSDDKDPNEIVAAAVRAATELIVGITTLNVAEAMLRDGETSKIAAAIKDLKTLQGKIAWAGERPPGKPTLWAVMGGDPDGVVTIHVADGIKVKKVSIDEFMRTCAKVGGERDAAKAAADEGAKVSPAQEAVLWIEDMLKKAPFLDLLHMPAAMYDVLELIPSGAAGGMRVVAAGPVTLMRYQANPGWETFYRYYRYHNMHTGRIARILRADPGERSETGDVGEQTASGTWP